VTPSPACHEKKGEVLFNGPSVARDWPCKVTNMHIMQKAPFPLGASGEQLELGMCIMERQVQLGAGQAVGNSTNPLV